MNAKEFFMLVVDLRVAQRTVDRTNGRDRQAVQYANDFARRVDAEIKRVQLIEKERMNPRLEL